MDLITIYRIILKIIILIIYLKNKEFEKNKFYEYKMKLVCINKYSNNFETFVFFQYQWHISEEL